MNFPFIKTAKTFLRRATLLALISATLQLITAAEPPACCSKTLAPGAPLPDKSLYQVASSWTNDLNARVQLPTFRGRPQIVTMFFARCEFACPLLVNDMKKIEAALPEQLRARVGFVLVSFDSRRDNPEALAAFRKQHQLNDNWTLLTGGPDDVQELAAVLGVKFKKDGRGQFAHSNLITLLNTEGEVVAQQVGLNQPGDELVSALKKLSGCCSSPKKSAPSSPVQ